MNEILPILCLKESNTCQYKRKTIDSILYMTGISNIKSDVRTKTINPEINTANAEEDINNLFISMIDAATSIYDTYVYSSYVVKPNLIEPTTEMGQHDCYPKNIIISKTNKLFPEENSIEVIMKSCTCSKIINNCIGAVFKVNIIRTNLPRIKQFTHELKTKEYERAYLIADPEVCGLYTKLDTGIKMLVKPEGFRKLLFSI